jgi:hypothetical protein
MRRPIPNDPVTGGDIEAYKEDFVGGDDPRFAAWARRRVNDLEFPETMPAYGSVKVDALGNVWVAAYSWRSEDRAKNGPFSTAKAACSVLSMCLGEGS